MTEAQELGLYAEERACDYILSLGWKVLSRNIKNKYGELDVIAVDDKNELVIVEVRCRTVGKLQAPLESIGPRKLHALIKSSMEFVNSLEWLGFWRIDVIGITLQDKDDLNNYELEHIRDITEGMNILS